MRDRKTPQKRAEHPGSMCATMPDTHNSYKHTLIQAYALLCKTTQLANRRESRPTGLSPDPGQTPNKQFAHLMDSLMRPLSESPTRSTSVGLFRCLRVRLLTHAGMVAENSIVWRVSGTPCARHTYVTVCEPCTLGRTGSFNTRTTHGWK